MEFSRNQYLEKGYDIAGEIWVLSFLLAWDVHRCLSVDDLAGPCLCGFCGEDRCHTVRTKGWVHMAS